MTPTGSTRNQLLATVRHEAGAAILCPMNTRIEEERECIRCDSTPVVDTAGYCVHCYWAVKAEVQEGLSQLGEYLRKRALFDNWCATHEAGA